VNGEEIAAVVAALAFTMRDEPPPKRRPVSPWAEAARDYDSDDDELCFRKS
jgi:hypothetical protein